MIERVLLVINRAAATGHSEAVAARLEETLSDELGQGIGLSLEVLADHPAVTSTTRDFLAESDVPALVIAGGGGGTLRAVIEGICAGCGVGQLPGPDRVRLAALRMGSGNVLAKQFGIPRDSEGGLKGIVASLRANRTVPCCVMRFEVGRDDQKSDCRYAATLGGFGQFGRVPGDLARWHRRLPILHKLTAGIIGIERMTSIEYGIALLTRSILCALRPKLAEEVRIRIGDRTESLRLLAGAVMNFRLAALPFDPVTRVEESAVSLNFIPYTGRLAALGLVWRAKRSARCALKVEISAGTRLEIELTDRASAEFFLDEDPMTFHGKLVIQVAGTLAFVPGPLNVSLDGTG